jgi:hypothetical protein
MAFAQAERAPEVRQSNGISYVSGGISDSGQQRTMAMGKGMSLQLVFAEADTGSYLAKVNVRITDGQGAEVLAVPSSDPLLFADLKPGTYRIMATVRGRQMERTVIVPSEGHRQVVFQWPASDGKAGS